MAEEIVNELVEEEINKSDKFKEVSLDLVRKAIVSIEKLEKVANRKQFDYSEEEVDKMFTALQEALDDTKAKFKVKKEFNW